MSRARPTRDVQTFSFVKRCRANSLLGIGDAPRKDGGTLSRLCVFSADELSTASCFDALRACVSLPVRSPLYRRCVSRVQRLRGSITAAVAAVDVEFRCRGGINGQCCAFDFRSGRNSFVSFRCRFLERQRLDCYRGINYFLLIRYWANIVPAGKVGSVIAGLKLESKLADATGKEAR